MSIEGGDKDARLRAARDLLSAGRAGDAAALLGERLSQAPDDLEALGLMALAHWRGQANAEGARPFLARALALAPGSPRVLTLAGEHALHSGALKDAEAFARRALAAAPGDVNAFALLAFVAPENIDDDVLEGMRRLSGQAQGRLSQARRARLSTALGRALEARGEFDEAFDAFACANQLGCAGADLDAEARRLAAVQAQLGRSFFAERSEGGRTETGAVFILGMPRSGSTLIERMLFAHPAVESCGESGALQSVDSALRARNGSTGSSDGVAYLGQLDAETIAKAADGYLRLTAERMRQKSPALRIDKRLDNFRHAGLARLLFPDARLIYAHRHPLDTCVSAFKQGFAGHGYLRDLESLGAYYRLHHRYMLHWRDVFGEALIACRYERLTDDFATRGRALVERLGLNWDPACAAPERAGGVIETASAAQLREPVDRRGVNAWRRYERRLGPLAQALGGWDEIDRMAEAFP